MEGFTQPQVLRSNNLGIHISILSLITSVVLEESVNHSKPVVPFVKCCCYWAFSPRDGWEDQMPSCALSARQTQGLLMNLPQVVLFARLVLKNMFFLKVLYYGQTWAFIE